jgi:hypothetical protein
VAAGLPCAMRALALPVPAYAVGWSADRYAHTGYWGEVAVAALPADQASLVGQEPGLGAAAEA